MGEYISPVMWAACTQLARCYVRRAWRIPRVSVLKPIRPMHAAVILWLRGADKDRRRYAEFGHSPHAVSGLAWHACVGCDDERA